MDTPTYHASHEPSILDILVVKAMMTQGTPLPMEVVDSILDLAEYWAHSTTVCDFPSEQQGIAGRPPAGEDTFLLRAIPLGFPPSFDPDHSWQQNLQGLRLKPDAVKPHQRQMAPEIFQRLIHPKITLLEHPCRKVVFTLRSRDQGWGGEREDRGTYHGSWTWFESGLEKFEASGDESEESHCHSSESGSSPQADFSVQNLRTVWPLARPGNVEGFYEFVYNLMPDHMRKIQANKVADGNWHTYQVTWRWTDDIHPHSPAAEELEAQGRGSGTASGEFVRSLKVGDVVTVWGRARFPGWVNYVQTVQVDVYWAV